MVNSPVGPPGDPPVPTVGAWFLGSFPGLSVCAETAATITNVLSAATSALFPNLIAFLLDNRSKVFARRAQDRECARDYEFNARASQHFEIKMVCLRG